jgi:Ser/Thr protein kinase RdoA (MazF antagonist)
MRPFADLTASGQRRRIRTLAGAALERYRPSVHATHYRFHAESFNTVFKVTSADRQSYALRIGPEKAIHRPGTELAEAAWMTALGEDGACRVARVVTADNGSPVVHQRHGAVPQERTCVLFDWVSGQTVGERMDPGLARRTGTLAAILHEHAARAALPAPPPVLTADRVLYWSVENRLPELTAASGTLLLDATQRVQETIDALWRRPPHRPHLIHGDLTPGNLIVDDDDLVPIDFQDLVWGFDVQDLAITIASLARRVDGPTLIDAFGAGYAEIRNWPELPPALLATLVAGRRLQQLNLGLHRRRPGLSDFVDRHTALIHQWMTSPPTSARPASRMRRREEAGGPGSCRW